MDTITALQTIGFSEKQAQVYVALLQLGPSSAYVIAEKSGLKKPTTYVILEELREKGVVKRVPRKRKQLYVAQVPQEVFAHAHEQMQQAQNVLPQLEALTRTSPTKVHALYFEGTTGIKHAVEYRLKEKQGEEIIGFNAQVEDVDDEFRDYIDEYNDKLKRLDIRVRSIVPKHQSLKRFRRQDQAYNRTVKEVSQKEYSSSISIEAFDDIVRIIDFTNDQAMVIENSNVAGTVRQIFEMVWKKLP